MANPALYRPGTSDRNIWESVVQGNEYRLPDQFEPNSFVLDIGANTGAFTYACIQRGAAKVVAFEPDPGNFILFRKQLKQEIKDGRVEVYPLAVVGGSGFEWRTFSGVVQKDGEVNHGGAFLFDRNGGDFGLGKYLVNRPFTVPCIGFEEIQLPNNMVLNTLKIDAEGSEWDILMRSMSAEKFGRLVGEYHPIEKDQHLSLQKRLTRFDWQFQPHPNSELGLFFATLK